MNGTVKWCPWKTGLPVLLVCCAGWSLAAPSESATGNTESVSRYVITLQIRNCALQSIANRLRDSQVGEEVSQLLVAHALQQTVWHEAATDRGDRVDVLAFHPNILACLHA
jgi:hypothetical protein